MSQILLTDITFLLENREPKKEEIEQMKQVLSDIFNEIWNVIKPIMDKFIEFMKAIFPIVPPRIKHLALHHKKWRIRKKNMRRLFAYD